MAYPFFGLQTHNENGEEDYTQVSILKSNTHKEVFALCYGSQGGYNWTDVYYNMPSYLRRYYLTLLKEQKEAENPDNGNKSKNSSPSRQGSIPRGPNIQKPSNIRMKK